MLLIYYFKSVSIVKVEAVLIAFMSSKKFYVNIGEISIKPHLFVFARKFRPLSKNGLLFFYRFDFLEKA